MIRRHAGAVRAFLPLVCAALLVFGRAVPALAAFERVSPSHAIAIALDNSGSMYAESAGGKDTPIDRWSNAKYSLEVLAAMLGEHDTMSVYAMDAPGVKLKLEGSAPAEGRVRAVHDKDLGISEHGTDVTPVREALNQLKGSDADERYLVITTDGEFNVDGERKIESGAEGIEVIQGLVDEASSAGIKTLFLAISKDARTIEANEAKGVSVRTADSDTILSAMTDMANEIFGRATLPGEYVGAGGKLTFDVPMSQVIVFAQGENAKVGSLTQEGGKTHRTTKLSTVSVSRPPAPPSKDFYIQEFVSNESLHGQVAVFDEELPQGAYQLDVSGADTVDIYYLPLVDIAVDLTDGYGGRIRLSPTQDNVLEAGTYKPEFTLLDPFTGDALSSKLVQGVEGALVVDNGGERQQVGPGETFDLTGGEADLDATASKPGVFRVTQSYTGIEVTAPLSGMSVDLSELQGALDRVDYTKLDDPASRPHAQVKVLKDDGTALTPEEWDALTLTLESPDGFTWDAQKTEVPGTFDVSPTSFDGSLHRREKAAIHVLPWLMPAPERITKATAEVVGASFPYGGYGSFDTQLAGPLNLIPYIVAGALLLLALLYAVKPKLPKLAPSLAESGAGPAVRLRRVRVKNKWFPLGAQKASVSFMISDVKVGAPTYFTGTALAEFPASFTVKALRKKGGARRMRIESPESLRRVEKQHPQGDPFHPNFNLNLDKPLTSGQSLSFYARHRNPARKREAVRYTLSFYDKKVAGRKKPGAGLILVLLALLAAGGWAAWFFLAP